MIDMNKIWYTKRPEDPVFYWYNRPVFKAIVLLQLLGIIKNHTLMPRYLRSIQSLYLDCWRK